MVSRISPFIRSLAVLATLASGLVATPALSGTRDKDFFDGVSGSWKGPGEIIAGKYKGTKFSCNLTGQPEAGRGAGIKLDGTCRVGVFSQPMSAVISQAGNSYTGKFLDGAEGKGLDIVSGNVSGNKVVVGINRKKLNGAMIARLQDDRTMNVTISVKVQDKMIPVIGMILNRQMDDIAVGAIK